jgi:hypothetical protein
VLTGEPPLVTVAVKVGLCVVRIGLAREGETEVVVGVEAAWVVRFNDQVKLPEVPSALHLKV